MLNKLKDLWKDNDYNLSADELLSAVSTESKKFAVERMNSMLDVNEGVGIITKQNTTKDVKPGETRRQANKLGLMLNKDELPNRLYRSWKNERAKTK
jgi:hypothetical protein